MSQLNIEDKIAACFTEDRAQFTDFLTLEQADEALHLLCNSGLEFKAWGGYPDAERCMFEISGETLSEEYPISTLCGAWDKFADISHRDILGAVMGTGIERKCVGDILVDAEKRKFYIFVNERLANYLQLNVDRIGRASVKWNVVKDMSELPTSAVSERRLPVSSLRIDAIIAAVFNLSRQKAQEMIGDKKVFINHTLVSKVTHNVLPMASVVVRGLGKFIFIEQSGISKKGKIYITIKQYL